MALDVKNLKISLSSGEIIVDDVSFEISQGQMLSLVGGSGAGKTTVCRAVMGLLPDTYIIEGSINFGSRDLRKLNKKQLSGIYGKEICFIMQNPMTAFNPSIRIGKQLERSYLHHHREAEKTEIRKRYEAILNELGLGDTERILKNYPFELSGGMLQRIMIAEAIIEEPKLLVADEATTAIDACNRMELMQQMKKLCGQGMSVLFVTHDLKAASISDRIMIMNHGRIVETGQTDMVMNSPQNEFTKELVSACVLKREGRDAYDRTK